MDVELMLMDDAMVEMDMSDLPFILLAARNSI